MIENQATPEVPSPGPPPRLPPSSPRSAEAPASPGAFTIAIIGCGAVAYFAQKLLDSNVFPPNSPWAKALAFISVVASIGALTCVYVGKKLGKERDSQDYAYRLERDEIRAKNPKAFADVEDEDDEP